MGRDELRQKKGLPVNPLEETDLTRYLLGELDEDERARLEESFFADDERFEQLLAAEDDLLDACARGELNAAARVRFERRALASPAGRERLLFARTLTEVLDDRTAPPCAVPAAAPVRETDAPPATSFLSALFGRHAWARYAAAAALLLIIPFPWLLYERAYLRDELSRLRDERAALEERAQRAEAEQARSADALAQLKSERVSPTPVVTVQNNEESSPRPSPTRGTTALVAAFTLTPGLTRGGGSQTLDVPAGRTMLGLRLNVGSSSHESYSAVIETAGGREVWRADRLKAGAATLVLPPVSARTLPPGDYVVLLSGRRADGGLEPVAEYSFRIAAGRAR